MSRPALVPELYCADLPASLAFCVGGLGFEIVYDRPEAGFAYLRLGGADLMLEQAPKEGGERVWWTGPPERPLGRGVNFQIEVENADALAERATSAGFKLFLTTEDRWYRRGDREVGNRQFLIQDPDGYLFRFFTSLGDRTIETR